MQEHIEKPYVKGFKHIPASGSAFLLALFFYCC